MRSPCGCGGMTTRRPLRLDPGGQRASGWSRASSAEEQVTLDAFDQLRALGEDAAVGGGARVRPCLSAIRPDRVASGVLERAGRHTLRPLGQCPTRLRSDGRGEVGRFRLTVL